MITTSEGNCVRKGFVLSEAEPSKPEQPACTAAPLRPFRAGARESIKPSTKHENPKQTELIRTTTDLTAFPVALDLATKQCVMTP